MQSKLVGLMLDGRTANTLVACAAPLMRDAIVARKWHGRNPLTYIIEVLGPSVVADAACWQIAYRIIKDSTYKRDLLRSLGQAMEDRVNAVLADDPEVWKKFKAKKRRVGGKTARRVFQKKGKFVKLPFKVLFGIGHHLLELYKSSVGGIMETRKPSFGRGRTRSTEIVATKEMLQWLIDNKVDGPWRPLSEPPVWKGPTLGDKSFVHHHGEYGQERTCLDVCDKETLATGLRSSIRAANHLQSVAWRRNENIYRVLQQAWKSGAELGPLPSSEPPPKLVNGTRREFNGSIDAYYEWRIERHNAASMLYLASMMSTDPAYYLWGADFRGRLYPRSRELSPHGSDLGRALLEFHEGKRMGPDGAAALGEHGANMFGGRGTFDEVAEWLIDNQDNIIDSAKDPFECQWWTRAEKPWRFLAFCYEWCGWVRDGEDHVSYLPCQIDASANCWQIVANLLGDHDLAKLTNLTDSPFIYDLYAEIGKGAAERFENDATLRWLHTWKETFTEIPRHVIKLSMISYCLGGTRFTIANKIIEWAIERWRYSWPFDGVEAYRLGWDLANHIFSEAEERFPLKPLHSFLRRMAKKKDYMSWRTPSGFPAVSEYLNYERGRAGPHGIITTWSHPIGPNRRSLVRTMPANWIHSVDAGAMHLIINRLEDEGIEVSAIHDCIGAHACDIFQVHTAAREVYAQVFSTDLLDDLAGQMELPPYDGPRYNDFDPTEMLDADYMWR